MKSNEVTFSNESLIEVMKDTFIKNASFRFKVKGYSMSPFIRDDDVLTLSPLNNCSIGIGRVVAFIHPYSKKLVIHRILGRCKCGRHYIIKGDNSPQIDGVVSRKYMLGYVKKVERGKRNIYLGLGWERRLVVYLSKMDFFRKLFFLGNFIPLSIKQKIKRFA